MLKVDLHTHSQASADGGLRLTHYEKSLSTGKLDVIAITDHNTITFALAAQEKLGDRIIVGEEIMTTEGEIIGLFLQQAVEPLQSPEKTIQAIRAQGGVVYIPHPFETLRNGLPLTTLERIIKDVDIIEIYNSRAMQRAARVQAVAWANKHDIVGAASSDAHGPGGWNRTYSEVAECPTASNIKTEFHKAQLVCKDIGIIGRMYPTMHRTKRKFQKHG